MRQLQLFKITNWLFDIFIFKRNLKLEISDLSVIEKELQSRHIVNIDIRLDHVYVTLFRIRCVR